MSLAADRAALTVALIGNPNVGKSTLFGALSGQPQRVGNYPGVTVDLSLGRVAHAGGRWTLVDLPGTYSLAPRSPDEMVAVDVLLGRRDDAPAADVLLCVVAADNLERNLYLVSQVLELGRPTVLALTMQDVATAHGVEVDPARLSAQLGLPVVPVQAHKGVGLEPLKAAVAAAAAVSVPKRESPFPEAFQAEVARLEAELAEGHPGEPPVPRYLVERLLLDSGGYLEAQLAGGRPRLRPALVSARERLTAAGCPVPAVEATARYAWVAKVVEGVITREPHRRPTATDRLDAVLTHRVAGTAVLALITLLIFHAVFTWAEAPMGWIETGAGWLAEKVGSLLPEGALQSLLTEGVIGGIGSVVVFLPQILILFFFLALLEDCGYLARAAYLMDRLMTRVGLSGKSFIPLMSSFACAIPGVMASRVIENRRDRLATILVAPLMTCSARLPVYTLMVAAFIPPTTYLGGWVGLRGLVLLALYLLGILTAASVALVLRRTLLRGLPPPFVMELPPYKWPSPRVVLYRMADRAWDFLSNAGTIILAVSVLMWAALYYPRLPAADKTKFGEAEARAASALKAAESAGDEAAVAARTAELEAVRDRAEGEQKRRSLLGRAGRVIEPVVRPLGWDWRLGSAVLASFPAREVVVATLGVLFDAGSAAADEEGGEGGHRLRDVLRGATRPDGRPLFTVPVALSVMVFFALCAQCVSTLAVIRRETGGWRWPTFSFVYMTVLAYVGALLTFQVGTWLAG